MDRPDEVIVMEVRRRPRRRKLSGYNSYFDSLSSSSYIANAKNKNRNSNSNYNNNNQMKNYSVVARRTPSSSCSHKSNINAVSRMSGNTVEKKKKLTTTTRRRRLGQNNYLESLSASSSRMTTDTATTAITVKGNLSFAGKNEPSEAFQRKLLTARLKIQRKKRKLAAKVQNNKSSNNADDSYLLSASAKKKEEVFHRRLLIARLQLEDRRKSSFIHRNIFLSATHNDDYDNGRATGTNILASSSSKSTDTKKGSSSYLEKLSAPSVAWNSSSSSANKVKTREQSDEISKNPYLDEKPTEYELNVDPSALVSRILSVREQLSKEWVEDLRMLTQLNDEIMHTFEEYTKKAKNEAIPDDDDEEDDNVEDDVEDTVQNIKDSSEVVKNLSDLESLLKTLGDPDYTNGYSPKPGVTSSPLSSLSSNFAIGADDDDGKRNAILDRNALYSWGQSLSSRDRSSSPYRKANFDLLLLLSTQESIHRVLNSYKEDREVRPETFDWLFSFYKEHAREYFDGHQTYARSEDFLESMLKSPRTLIETKNQEMLIAWVDPAQIVEDIVRNRSQVALNWISVVKRIPDEHTDLRRLLFSNMVSKSLPEKALTDTILTAVKNAEEQQGSSTKVFGAFE